MGSAYRHNKWTYHAETLFEKKKQYDEKEVRLNVDYVLVLPESSSHEILASEIASK